MCSKKLDFNAPFEQLGTWWLAESDTIKLPGLLRVSNDTSVRLEIIGSLLSNPDNPTNEDNLTIYGILKGGTPVTMISAYRQNSVYGPLQLEEEYESQDVLFGDHINPEKGFQKLVLEISNLGDWLNFNSTQIKNKKKSGKYQSIHINHQIPEDITLDMPSIGATGILYTVAIYRSDAKQANLEVLPKFSIEFSESQSLNYCTKLKYRIQCLWTFLVGHPVEIERCTLKSGESEMQWKFPRHRWFRPKESLHVRQMVAPYSVINTELNAILEKWFSQWIDLEPAIILFFSSFFRPDLFVQTHFLNMAQASEAFHRIILQDIPESARNAFNNTRKIIKTAIQNEPKDIRQRISESISFAEEPTFANRIQDLVGKIDLHTQEKYIGEIEGFSHKVKNLRNYLTHYAGKLKEKVTQDLNEISLMTEQLRFILYHHLCLQFIATEEVKNLLKDKFRYLEGWKRRVASRLG